MRKLIFFLTITTLLLNSCKLNYITSPMSHPNFSKKGQTEINGNIGSSLQSYSAIVKANHSYSDKNGIVLVFLHAFPNNTERQKERINKSKGSIDYGEFGYVYYKSIHDSKVSFYSTTLGYGIGFVETNGLPNEPGYLDYFVRYQYHRLYGQFNIYLTTNQLDLGIGLRLSQLFITNSEINEQKISNSFKKSQQIFGFTTTLRAKVTKEFVIISELSIELPNLGNSLFGMTTTLGVGYRF